MINRQNALHLWLSSLVRYEMTRQELTQADLARRMKVLPSQVSLLLSGRGHGSLDMWERMLTAIGTDPAFWPRPNPDLGWWGVREVAVKTGLLPKTIREYHKRGNMPRAERTTPVLQWRDETIRAWFASRQGR